jgi:dGTPase
VEHVVCSLYEYYRKHPERLPAEIAKSVAEFGIEEVVKDHVASMTDRFARNTYLELFVPSGYTE